MLDCWLQRQLFHVYSGREQIEQYIKPIQKYDRDEPTEATTFRLPLAKYGQLALNENNIFCSSYNELTPFRILQKRSLTCRDRGLSKHVTHYDPRWAPISSTCGLCSVISMQWKPGIKTMSKVDVNVDCNHWVSDCRLTPNEQCFSYIMAKTSYIT
jgi:hypothetical protein